MQATNTIRVRDPFIYVDHERGRYYLYASCSNRLGEAGPQGIEVYTSCDLAHWDEPQRVFTPPSGFWGTRDFWAPEMHEYGGRYYLFASFSGEGRNRGTQISAADAPTGPFSPLGDGSQTPHEWMALDGTLYVEDGQPWMVFCHEWLQIKNGTVEAMPLSADLSRPLRDPTTLFRATDAPWVRPIVGHGRDEGYVTDGCFLHRATNGELLMLWSSFGDEGYALGLARSASGAVLGPWTHDPEPLFRRDGGHGMLFVDLEGRLRLALHAPNERSLERAHFFQLSEADGRLRLEG